MLELYIVRHGESIRNYAAKLAHQGDLTLLQKQLDDEDFEPGWELTEQGKEQARIAGDFLRANLPKEPDSVFVSPYFRTLQTVKSINFGPFPMQDWRIRERRWGDTSSLGTNYQAETYLEELTHAGEASWRTGYPGGESVEDLVPHVKEFVLEELWPRDGQTIVLVTHGGAMKALEMVIEGSVGDPLKSAVPNASVLHLKLETLLPDGMASGNLQHVCPWMPAAGPEHWQHFG